jgi:hypothetical protein
MNESTKLSSHVAYPLTNHSLRSKLKDGPKRLQSPITEIHETPERPVSLPDVSHIVGPPKMGTIREFKLQYRDPHRMRHLRLQQVFETCYGDSRTKELVQISDQIKLKLDEEREEGRAVDQHSTLSRPVSPSRSRAASPSSPSRPTSPPTQQQREAYHQSIMLAESTRQDQSHPPPPATRPTRSTNPTNRINWKSEWKKVRGVDSINVKANYTGEDDEEYLPPVSSLEDEAKRSYLPVTHPVTRPSTTLGTGSFTTAATSIYHSTNPPPSIPVVITRIRPQTARPYNSYKEYEKKNTVALQEEVNNKMEYQGIFRGGYLTPYEKERKEYQQLKNKFLNGDFKTYSGKASEIKVRSNGGIQAHGPYPAPIQSEKEMTKVGNYGPWKPTHDLYPNQRDRTFDTISRNTSRNKLQTR